MKGPTMLLSHALRANAAFSAVAALIALIFAPTLVDFIFSSELTRDNSGLDRRMRLLGVGLLGFAAYCFTIGRKPYPSLKKSMIVIVSDVIWVVISLAILLGFKNYFTPAGIIIVFVIAIIVGSFAGWQWLGWKRQKMGDL